MKRHFLLPSFLAAGILLLSGGCKDAASPPEESYTTLSAPDSLIPMVEKEIERKRSDVEKVEEFKRRKLPRNFDEKLREYLPVIKKYSKRYGLDWRLIVALILKESHFEENARSHVGARGLMQIMPRTARELHRELDYENIIRDPRENITAGIYHLYKQQRYFRDADPVNRLKLAMAAYNCGPARIIDAQDIAEFKELNPLSWEGVRECLPLLTPDSWQLHLEVWPKGVPTYGYFYGFPETIDYVDDIAVKYDVLTKMYFN